MNHDHPTNFTELYDDLITIYFELLIIIHHI